MPSGAPICRLRASARRTSDNGSGGSLNGWPTPNVPSGGRSIQHAELRGQTAVDPRTGKKVQVGLEAVAKMAGWPTPQASVGGPEPTGATGRKLSTVAGWATPCYSDGSKNVRTPEGAAKEAQRKGGNNDLGTTAGLSVAPTATRGGSLNPAFSRWLMGFPAAWGKLRAYGNAIVPARRGGIHPGLSRERNDMAMTPDPNWYGLVFILLVGIAWVLLFGRYDDDDPE